MPEGANVGIVFVMQVVKHCMSAVEVGGVASLHKHVEAFAEYEARRVLGYQA